MVDIYRVLRRHLPRYEVVSLVELGQGLENAAYKVNNELIVRASKERDATRRATTVRREAALLAALPEWSTLPVPQPVFADPNDGVLAYATLPGDPLNVRPVTDPRRLPPVLGEFLRRLHDAPLRSVSELVAPDPYPMPAWHDDAHQAYRGISSHIPLARRRPIEEFLASPPPPEPRTLTLCHNDLGSEHILADADASTITGVIDWTDAAVADPMRDLAMVLRDFGPDVFAQTTAVYGPRNSADLERAVFYARCSVLEDIAYGVSSGARHYADAGIAHLTWIFEDRS